MMGEDNKHIARGIALHMPYIPKFEVYFPFYFYNPKKKQLFLTQTKW